ncbi:MAG: CPBP family intramembrane metalloprotease [Bryobacteraceae bacterium]|nr:type II CAAX endopeptidase family protein [Bryobacterales bacterium]NUM99910.1 CPBP family intramembrane metalloprotease [Bryobacteraceae bacterium]
MPTEKLNSPDRRLIWVVLFVAVLSLIYTRANFNAAFPQASIDLKLSKRQITARASEYLRTRNLDPSGFRNVTLFAPQEESSIYLERELGLEEANRLMRERLAVWRWRARWFRPPGKEERIVQLSPGGDMVGFEHVIAENAPGSRLSRDEALAIAQGFLKGQTQAPHKLVEDQRVDRPNRSDYLFTWEEDHFRAKDATYRRTVVVQGKNVGKYDEFLHVPEAWRRSYAALRSQNTLWAQAASAVYLLLVIVSLIVLFNAVRRREIPWNAVLIIAGAVGVLMVLTNWNSLPLALNEASTSTPLGETVTMTLLLGVASGVGMFLYVALGAAAGAPLYRQAFPGHLPVSLALSPRALRTKEFFLATITGYGFAAAHIAFVVAFYLIGRKFGIWSPQEVQYSNLLSTYLPWLFPLTISLLAATSEEFWFRLFAIPLLRKWVRFTWLAVVLPAFVWGFLHAGYPQQPPYIRGIEVGVIGVAAGYLMIRFGILATLVWHYTVDAVLIGMFLFQTDSWYFRISGFVVAGAVAIPLILSIVYYRRQNGFQILEAPEVREAVVIEPSPSEAPAQIATVSTPAAPSWPVRRLYAAAALGLVAVIFFQPRPFGGFIQVRLTREEAYAAADHEMRRRNLGPDTWIRAGRFLPNLNPAPLEYIRRIAGSETAEKAVRDHTHTAIWRVRYFKPAQKEEWRVYVDQSGAVVRTDHLLDENAAGAQLPPEQARSIAEDWLRGQHIPVNRWSLVDSQTRKRENRTDHTFVWENPDFRIGEARVRWEVQVIGGEPSFQRSFIKLPEQWLRDFARPRIQRFLAPGFIGVLVAIAFILFLKSLSAGRHTYHTRTYVLVTLTTMVLNIAGTISGWPGMYNGYDTAMPWSTFLAGMVIGICVLVLVLALAVLLGVVALDVLRQSVTTAWRRAPAPLLRAASVTLLIWGFNACAKRLFEWVPGPRYSLDLWSLPDVSGFFPAIEIVAGAARSAVLWLALGVIAVVITVRLLRPSLRLLFAGTVAALLALSGAATILQWAAYAGIVLVAFGLLILVIKSGGPDPVTCGVSLFWLGAIPKALTFAGQQASWLRWNGVMAFVLAVFIGLAALWMARARNAS